MLNRGGVVILAILLTGTIMAATAVWYQVKRNQRCLEAWGAESANLIRHAAQVEALKLGDAADASTPHDAILSIADKKLTIVRRIDISTARGLVHARHALIVDTNYESTATKDLPHGEWRYALRFTEGDRQATLLLDPEYQWVMVLPKGGTQFLREPTMRAEIAFIEREFAAAEQK